MNPMIGMFVGILVAVGIVVVLMSFQPRQEPTASRESLAARWRRLRDSLDRTTFTLLWVGIIGGVALSLISGWVIMALAVPAAVVFVPRMLSGKEARVATAKLDAIEGWTRQLAGLVATHATLERSITNSVHSSPELLARPVATLSARLQAKWDTRAALRAFAEDIADPSGDIVIAHLLMAAELSGPGLADALGQAADSIQDEVRTRRDIESERESQRQVMRIITGFGIVAVLLITLFSPLAGNYFAPYRTASGQLVLVALLAGMAGALWISHRLAKLRRIPRVIDVAETDTSNRWTSLRDRIEGTTDRSRS